MNTFETWLIICLFFVLLVAFAGSRKIRNYLSGFFEDPVNRLKRRFEDGEISENEYREKMKYLGKCG